MFALKLERIFPNLVRFPYGAFFKLTLNARICTELVIFFKYSETNALYKEFNNKKSPVLSNTQGQLKPY